MSNEISAPPPEDRCPNCGAERRGDWCHTCGQKNVHERLSVRSIFADMLDHVFNLDSKILSTLRGMTLRPGRTARSYIEGRRARYANPLRYCIAFVALYFIVRTYFGIGIMDDLPGVLDYAEEGSAQEALQQYMAERTGRIVDWVAIGVAPLLALVLRIFFRNPEANIAERLAFAFFLQGHSHLYALLVLPLVALDPSMGGTVRMVVQVGFSIWAIASFYDQNTLWGWVRAIMTWALTVLLVGLVSGLAAIPYMIRAAKELGLSGATP